MKRWQKIGIGLALAAILIAALAIGGACVWQRISYPFARPMPAVVSESMPEILARLDAALKTNAPLVRNRLQPGLSAGDIDRLEQQYHVSLPDDLRMLYEWHNGTRTSTTLADMAFIPSHYFSPLEMTLADRHGLELDNPTLVQKMARQALVGYRNPWISLFSDGAGDGYWFDPQRRPSEGAIFYNFNEVGAYVIFPSAKNLMAGVLKCYEQGIYRVKPGHTPPELEEDFERATKVWTEFGASNEPD